MACNWFVAGARFDAVRDPLNTVVSTQVIGTMNLWARKCRGSFGFSVQSIFRDFVQRIFHQVPPGVTSWWKLPQNWGDTLCTTLYRLQTTNESVRARHKINKINPRGINQIILRITIFLSLTAFLGETSFTGGSRKL